MEMFRLYLLNLIKSGESSKKKIVSKGLPARTEFDRRTYERFNTKDKHMMLMNEQDIFFIRDISKRGFNVEDFSDSCLIYKNTVKILGQL